MKPWVEHLPEGCEPFAKHSTDDTPMFLPHHNFQSVSRAKTCLTRAAARGSMKHRGSCRSWISVIVECFRQK